MVSKGFSIAIACTLWLASSAGSRADEYRSGELFNLDLPKAVLSPKPIGPAAQFNPPASGAPVDHPGAAATEASTEPKAAAVTSKAEPRITVHKTHVAHLRIEKPRAAARTRLAHRHTNPLDAQARDTRIQVWPCRSGGICDWKR